MSKTQRNSIVSLINIILGFISVFLWYSMDLSLYFLVGSLFLTTIISQIISLFLPVKQKNKAKSSSIKKKTANKKDYQRSSSKNNNPYNLKPIEQLLTYDLKDLSGYDFEHLCYLYLKSQYKQVEQTPFAKDRGVDIVFVDEEGFRVAVQVKHKMESGKYVTNKEINQLTGAKRNHKCSRTMFITSTGYTKDARDLAKDHGMKINAYHWVENKVLRWREKEVKKRKLA